MAPKAGWLTRGKALDSVEPMKGCSPPAPNRRPETTEPRRAGRVQISSNGTGRYGEDLWVDAITASMKSHYLFVFCTFENELIFFFPMKSVLEEKN